MKHKSTDELLALYRATAVIHGQTLHNGPTSECNRAYDKLTRIRRELHSRGGEHLQRVLEFLTDEDSSVRTCAAADALAFAPEEGVRVLREVASGPPSMVRLDAEMVLKQWEAGEWDTSIP